MFKNRDVASGFLFILIALAFGISALINYPIGALNNPGPALIPLIISSFLLVTGSGILIKGLTASAEVIAFQLKNLVTVMLAIAAFAFATKYVNLMLGIVVLISIATITIPPYSVVRNAKIIAGLIAIAAVFKYGLGLDLPLV